MNVHAPAIATVAVLVMFVHLGGAYGHGLELDTIQSIDVAGVEASIDVELLADPGDGTKRLTITITDDEGAAIPDAEFQLSISHQGMTLLDDRFLATGGVLAADVIPGDTLDIAGRSESGAWRGTADDPLEVTGPIFQAAGLYTLEITILAPDGTAGDSGRADLSIVQTEEILQGDMDGNDVRFGIKSYFDLVSDLEYDPGTETVTFEMPFDWDDRTILHIPVVHVEVHFDKEFAEYNSPGYTGQVNGVDLFKSSISVDDYTDAEERIVHFVLLGDHLKLLKNQFEKSPEPPTRMEFSLSTSDEGQFPMTSYTRGERFSVDLSWDPPEVLPEGETDFIFTIRDGATGEPLRQSSYEFVIIQGGSEIHRAGGQAQIGGGIERFTFSEGQTGPTVIRFDDIRGTGERAEFGLVVVPEFGAIIPLVFMAAMIIPIILYRGRGRITV